MSTLTLRPNAAGDNTALISNSPPNYSCVDENGSGDGDTTRNEGYPAVGGQWLYDLYSLPDHASESGTINKVTIYIRHRRWDSGLTTGAGRTVIKTNSTEDRGSTETPPDGTYVLHYKEYTQNPNTSAAWTWGEVDALQVGYNGYAEYDAEMKNSSRTYVTQVWVEVDYTVAVTFQPWAIIMQEL